MAVNTATKNRKELPILEKVEVLLYTKTHDVKSTAAHFGISQTTVKTIKKREDELLELQEQVNETKAGSKRFRSYRFTHITVVNNQTWKWLQQKMKKGEQITNRLIKEKALSYAHAAGILNFSASKGWLEAFRRRYGYVSPGARSKSTTETNENKAVAVSLPKKLVIKGIDSIPLNEGCNLHAETVKEDSIDIKQEKDCEEPMIDSMVNEKALDCDNEKEAFASCDSEKRLKLNQDHKTKTSSDVKPKPIPCLKQTKHGFWTRARTEAEIALLATDRKRINISINNDDKKKRCMTLAERDLSDSRRKTYMELFF